MPSLSKSVISKIKSLGIKKYRDKFKLFIAEGITLVSEIQLSTFKIDGLFATKAWIGNNPESSAIEVSAKELSRLSSLKTPNEVLCVVEIPQHGFNAKKLNGLSLVLDNISDPGNMGSIIRTADWFGIEHIFCSKNSADIYNPKVVQASMGSITRVKVHYVELIPFIESCNGKYPVYGLALDGKNMYNKEIKRDALLVIGNESQGISEEVASLLTDSSGIPAFGGAESLNAAVATAIACYEYNRKI